MTESVTSQINTAAKTSNTLEAPPERLSEHKHALHVYAVDWEALGFAIGCGDEQLGRELDAELDDALGMTDAGPSEDLALAHLILGRPADGDPAVWIYAFERLCRRFGRQLDTSDWRAVAWRDIERASGALSSCHINGSPLTELFCSALPVALPRAVSGAGPTIGALEPSRVAQLLPRVTRGWLDLDPQGIHVRLVSVFERWLEEADEEGWALVGIAE